MGLDRIRIVLVRPREAQNVGAVARAMKNMGLARLVLVDAPAFDEPRAATLAVHAEDVLAARCHVPSLATALAGCGLVVGTSGRATAARDAATTPRALAPVLLAAAAANDVALVFGPEDHGLALEELKLCQHVLAIPTSDAYPSLNLAQAVGLCAYELWTAAAPPAAARELAPHERLEFLWSKLESGLAAVSFLHGEEAPAVMRRLRTMLGRAALDDDEVQMLLGVARQMTWAGTRARRPVRN
ncbi:MAG: TrmJ/YjtD family RNA methyltransferase [Deltaproteobacteria bacterium]|nr:TrmJ/YjtD family RNA methyltransferase [Deltaproteobacteria bacterium]